MRDKPFPQNKADVCLCFSSRSEMAAMLYQNLSLTEPQLIPQLENVIMIFVKEIKQQNSEMENLALAIKRYPLTHLSIHPSINLSKYNWKN